jgi:uncharacterized membrane protein/thiamine biosynthesis lipoprotein ApbE
VLSAAVFAALLLAGVAPAGAAVWQPTAERFEFARVAMGTKARVVLYASDEEAAVEAARRAFELIEAYEQALSDYRPGSEVRVFQDTAAVGEWTDVSPLLAESLRHAQELGARTDGAFGVEAGATVLLWRDARAAKTLPSPEEIETARLASGPGGFDVDADADRARVTRGGVKFDFGGIGKGLAAAAARNLLIESGHPSCLVDLGGDLALGAAPPGTDGWAIEVETGFEQSKALTLADTCIATSGDAAQWAEIDGVRYSHIVDPRSGKALDVRRAATVIHPDGGTADALASAACVLGPKGLDALQEGFPDAQISLWQIPDEPLIRSNIGVLAVLLAVLAFLFWFNSTGPGNKFFSIVPMLVFCYFLPTTLTTLGWLPDDSPVYAWIKTYLLPASLVLLILALDLPGIVRLGPKAIIMLLAGTAGVVIGGPVAFWIVSTALPESAALPEDTWRGLTALSGSWIGGGANFVALGQIAEATDSMIGLMVIVDVAVANIWMGVLLFMAGKDKQIDKITGANTRAIEELKERVAAFQEKSARTPTLADYLVMLSIAFVGTWIAMRLGEWLAPVVSFSTDADGNPVPFFSATVWKFILVTSLGLVLSLTRARNYDGVGASKIGSVFLYLLVASIGAHANFIEMFSNPAAAGLLAVGAIWMLIHIIVLLGVAIIIRAPIFFVAVGSQANIGGAASAPIVASAFHPSLAPVGVLLAVAGYVLGTYAGLACMWGLRLVAGA